jgi:hypothetical protein
MLGSQTQSKQLDLDFGDRENCDKMLVFCITKSGASSWDDKGFS